MPYKWEVSPNKNIDFGPPSGRDKRHIYRNEGLVEADFEPPARYLPKILKAVRKILKSSGVAGVEVDPCQARIFEDRNRARYLNLTLLLHVICYSKAMYRTKLVTIYNSVQ